MPNSELLAAAGAAIDNGVLVDERCRTSLPDIYAAGDVADHQHPLFGRMRVEHWNNGQRQGRAAAAAMLDRGQPYDYLPFVLVGSVRALDRVHRLRRQLGSPRLPRPPGEPQVPRLLSARWLVRAAVGLNRGGDPEDPKAESELKVVGNLIRGRVPVDPEKLANDDVELSRVAASS